MASEIRTLKDKDIQVLPRTRADAVSTTDGSTVQDKINSIPTDLADLTDDSTHRLVTDSEKQTWNNKSDFSGSYTDLTNKPSIPTVSTSISSESTTTAASSSAVKEVYDYADNCWKYMEPRFALFEEWVASGPYMPKSGGTFTGTIKAGSNYQSYSMSLLRNSKLVSTDTTPTYDGEIYWVYG